MALSATKVVLLSLGATAALAAAAAAPHPPRAPSLLLQAWARELDGTGAGASAAATPISRVVALLKEMQATLAKEMEEDKDLYDKLACWCQENKYAKGNEISAAEAKITDLESSIEALTSKVSELTTNIKMLDDENAATKKTLAEATAVRQKELKEFQGQEDTSIANIETLKQAIKVLSKQHSGAFPQLQQASLLELSSEDIPWGPDHRSKLQRSFDQFMEANRLAGDSPASPAEAEPTGVGAAGAGFMQAAAPALAAPVAPVALAAWTPEDVGVVRRALHAAAAFAQARHREAYAPQSGQILGILKQLKDEMEADLSTAQKVETERASEFAALRAAKEAELAEGERAAERKEDELAQAGNDLAEAKEDLGQVKASLSEQQKFMLNLKKTCSEGSAGFDERRTMRLAEINAVSQTIDILTADEARDTAARAYSFVQLASGDGRRRAASRIARAAEALRAGGPGLAVLATSVQLDSFARVKQAIDDMIGMLKTQQADEVKKNQWCNDGIHANTMTSMKTETLRENLQTKIDTQTATIQELTDGIATAKSQITELHVSLQRASENRKLENIDFQQALSDQVATQEVLKKALDKLATFYDAAALTQTAKGARKTAARAHAKQAPPVPQMEYAKSSGAEGVMQMIEKLIHEAQDLQKASVKSESEAQAQYETLVADVNGSVKALQEEIVSRTEMRAETTKDKLQAENELADAVRDLEGLAEYLASLHAECDYLTKNFDVRQAARAQEVEALQQAKQILSGAA